MLTFIAVAPDEVAIIGVNVTARGNNITLVCSHSGGPDNIYEWIFNDAILQEDSSTLTLDQVNSTHGGTYNCLVTNAAGNDSALTILSIEPYITVFPETYFEDEVNTSVTFSCMADGFPTPVVNWLKIDGFGVTPGMDTVASSSEVLEFTSLTYEDNGTYVCEASAQSPSGMQLESARATESVLRGKY